MTAPARKVDRRHSAADNLGNRRNLLAPSISARPGLPSAIHKGITRHNVLAYMWDMLDTLRRDFSERTAKCGWLAIPGRGDELVLRRTRGGRRGLSAHAEGLRCCGNPWECPVCMVKIKAARGQEIAEALTWWAEEHGRDCIALVTLTVAHAFGDDLARLRKGMTGAWRRLEQGRALRRRWRDYGVARDRRRKPPANAPKGWKPGRPWGGFIRALEVTDGPNGWHPHMHFLVISTRPLTPKCRQVRLRWRCPECHKDAGPWSEQRAPRCLKCDGRESFHRWLSTSWRLAVRRELDRDAVPSYEHGVDIQQADRAAQYLAKLGMEISAPGTKAARAGHRTYLDMLHAAAFDGDAASWDRSRQFCYGMKGAKMLFWSRGLKRRAGVADRTDLDVILAAERTGEKVASVDTRTDWPALRSLDGARVDLLEAAEDGGEEGVQAFIEAVRPIARRQLMRRNAAVERQLRAAGGA